MPGGISIHVVDVTRGLPAAGMRVEIFKAGGDKIAQGVLSPQGVLEHSICSDKVARGCYEAVFYVGEFYRQIGYSLPEFSFLDVAPFRFGIDDVEQHYHLPLKVSPWGFSLFRGG